MAAGGFGGMLGTRARMGVAREDTAFVRDVARYVAPQFQGPVAEQVKFSNDWARENRDVMFGRAVAGIVTAMQDYAQHKIEKGEPVPDMMTQPLTRVRP